jgi:chemotaxis response regulator CheB
VKAVKEHRAEGGGNRYRYVVIGGSAGGVEALRVILKPQAAIDTGAVDEVLSTEQIGRLLATLGEKATL